MCLVIIYELGWIVNEYFYDDFEIVLWMKRKGLNNVRINKIGSKIFFQGKKILCLFGLFW